jgi:ribosomal-protein-alanine N-acetyltransferase
VRSEPPRADADLAKPGELKLDFVTPRLALRPVSVDDLEDVWPWVSDPAFPRFMSWRAHVDRDETRAILKATAEQVASGVALHWSIVHEGKAVGRISLEAIEWRKRALRLDRAELGYWMAPPLWGQGLMTEAAQAVIRFGFEAVGLHKIVVRCFAENEASRRVIEKCGFRLVGRMEDDIWRDGTWHAHLLFEMLRSEHDDTTSTRRFVRK